MKKFALLGFIAVLSFGFTGCMNVNPEKQWNLPDPYKTTVVEVRSNSETRANEVFEFHVVVFEHMGRRAEVRVEKETFESVREGDKVDLELLSVTTTEDDKYFLEICYRWEIGSHTYDVVFRWDAKSPTTPSSSKKI